MSKKKNKMAKNNDSITNEELDLAQSFDEELALNTQVKEDALAEDKQAEPDALVKAEKQVEKNKKVEAKVNNNSNKKQPEDKNIKKTTKKKKEKKQSKIVKKFKETTSELKKVSWPSFSKVVKQTGVVIAVVIIFTVVLFGIDRLLALLFDLFTGALS